jgi:hypothetical protein
MEHRLSRDESLTNQLATLKTKDRSIDQVIDQTNPNVYTYLNGLDGFMALVESSTGVEVWNRTGRNQFRVGTTGREAINQVDQAAADIALRASNDDRMVVYPHVADGDIVRLQIGDRRVEVSMQSIKAYVAGGEIPKELASVISPMLPSGSQLTGRTDSPTFIIYRGPLVQGRGEQALASVGLEQLDGADLAAAFDRTYGTRMELFTSDDLRSGAVRYHSGLGSLMHPTDAMYASR